MVPHDFERTGKARKQLRAVVLDSRRLAVHDPARPHDLPAVRLTNRLVPEADAEDRDLRAPAPNHWNAHTCFGRRARPWRQNDPVRLEGTDLLHPNRVVTANLECLAKFAEIL